MNFRDLIWMALQNLWARRSSTAFNIFGIVVSCSMLLLVFAGTLSLIHISEPTRPY